MLILDQKEKKENSNKQTNKCKSLKLPPSKVSNTYFMYLFWCAYTP